MGDASSFHFACQRSGRCCRVPTGIAFVEASELDDLAAELEFSPAEFAKRFVRSVVDPNTGAVRLALRDRPDGACILLAGDHECSAYRARPKGCADFPFWPSVLEDAQGWERAVAMCPGIEERPAGAALQAAFEALDALLNTAEPPSACVFAEESGGPHVSGLEFEWMQAAPSQSTSSCPLRVGATCGAPRHAPLACSARTAAHADATVWEARFQALAEARDTLETTFPWTRRIGSFVTFFQQRHNPASVPLRP